MMMQLLGRATFCAAAASGICFSHPFGGCGPCRGLNNYFGVFAAFREELTLENIKLEIPRKLNLGETIIMIKNYCGGNLLRTSSNRWQVLCYTLCKISVEAITNKYKGCLVAAALFLFATFAIFCPLWSGSCSLVASNWLRLAFNFFSTLLFSHSLSFELKGETREQLTH